MIDNFNTCNISRKKFYTIVISVFLVLVWLCTPPGNKFAQMCFYGNNTKLLIAKITNNAETKEWLIHRNNAAYQLQMNNQKAALEEMDKAINTLPVYLGDKKLNLLYKDRALVRIYNQDYKGALDDYLKTPRLNMMETLRVAMIYKTLGKSQMAATYCNEILNMDIVAYAGYACLADIYASVDRYDTSVKIFDLLISRAPNNSLYYLDRAKYKLKAGDKLGYDEDVEKAKSLNSLVNKNATLIEDALHPAVLSLSIMKN